MRWTAINVNSIFFLCKKLLLLNIYAFRFPRKKKLYNKNSLISCSLYIMRIYVLRVFGILLLYRLYQKKRKRNIYFY